MKEFAVFHDKVTDVVVLKLKQGLPHPQIRIVGPTRAEVQLLEQLAAEHNALAKVKEFLKEVISECDAHGTYDVEGNICAHGSLARKCDWCSRKEEAQTLLDALTKEGK